LLSAIFQWGPWCHGVCSTQQTFRRGETAAAANCEKRSNAATPKQVGSGGAARAARMPRDQAQLDALLVHVEPPWRPAAETLASTDGWADQEGIDLERRTRPS